MIQRLFGKRRSTDTGGEPAANVQTTLTQNAEAGRDVRCSSAIGRPLKIKADLLDTSATYRRVFERILQAGVPVASRDHAEFHAERAKAECLAALPLSAGNAIPHTARLMQDELRRRQDRLQRAQAKNDAAEDAVQQAEEELAELEAPARKGWFAGVVLLSALLSGAVIFSGADFFKDGAYLFLKSEFFQALYGNRGRGHALAEAKILGYALASVFAAAPWVLVIATVGRVSALWKILLLLTEIGGAFALATLRNGGEAGLTNSALAIGGFELSLVIANALVLFGVAPALRSASDRHDRCRSTLLKLNRRRVILQRASEQLALAMERLEEQSNAFTTREEYHVHRDLIAESHHKASLTAYYDAILALQTPAKGDRAASQIPSDHASAQMEEPRQAFGLFRNFFGGSSDTPVPPNGRNGQLPHTSSFVE